MKNKLIKTIKNLPDWFELKKYEKAKDLSPGDWYDELMSRLYIRHCYTNLGKKTDAIPPNWEFIKKEGLLYFVAQREEFKFRISAISPHFHQIKQLKENPHIEEPTISSVDSINNFTMYGSFLMDTQEKQLEIFEKIFFMIENYDKEQSEKRSQLTAWMFQPFEDFPPEKAAGLKNKYGYARVDLDASDEQVKRDFALWLQQERTRREKPTTKKNFNQVDFDSWHECSILPYLDLMFWAELENVKINQYVIAQAIYHDAYDVNSEVDPIGRLKTTKKKADHLMSHKTMKLLELQTAG